MQDRAPLPQGTVPAYLSGRSPQSAVGASCSLSKKQAALLGEVQGYLRELAQVGGCAARGSGAARLVTCHW